jgi:NAD(P)-dependent dehydrogenase (short-subunit alcohol dehydrogenase family)
MTGLLQGDIAVVTGAAHGNGLAISRGLAAAGAAVALLDVDGGSVKTAAQEICANGGSAIAMVCDVTDLDACRSAAGRVRSEVGPASVLINNAGILVRHNIDSDDFESVWQKVLKVNIDGCMNMVRAFVNQLRETHGCIVNMASTASFVGSGNAVSYVTSKGALLQMTKALSIDLAPDGIRVNAIAPGRIATRMTAAYRDDPVVKAIYMTRTPLKRYGEPEDLVGPALFLASHSLSGYVTGATIPVDGGFLVGQ